MESNENIFGAGNYYKVWSGTMASIMGQFTGKEIAYEMAGGDESTEEDRLWVTFTIGDTLLGEHAFSVSKADALTLGQMFMAEDSNPAAEFTPDHADALAELFRQFSGTVALELKAALGTEINVRFKDTKKPTWNSVDNVSVSLLTEPRVTVASFIDTGLLSTLNKARAAEPEAEVAQETAAEQPEVVEEEQAKPIPEPPAREVAAAAADDGPRTKINDKNLDLLLDLELEVSVRFGGRQMLLKEVLDLSSGAMVELDRRVRDPIELILGGRVIARGEAVIVDGNYGIRITEVISRSQRLAQIA